MPRAEKLSRGEKLLWSGFLATGFCLELGVLYFFIGFPSPAACEAVPGPWWCWARFPGTLAHTGGHSDPVILDVAFQIGIAVLYIIACDRLLEHKEHTHPKPPEPEESAPADGLFHPGWQTAVIWGLSIVIAVLLKGTYPPIVTLIALVATFFAVEHLGSLDRSKGEIAKTRSMLSSASRQVGQIVDDMVKQGGSLEAARNELESSNNTLGTLLNRMGTKDWAQHFQDYMEAPVAMTTVNQVWDDLPHLPALLSHMGTDHKQTLREYVTMATSTPSLYTLLLRKFTAKPDVKATFVARGPVAAYDFMTPCCVHDQLNALSLLISCFQVRLVNAEQTRIAQETERWLDSSSLDTESGISAAFAAPDCPAPVRARFDSVKGGTIRYRTSPAGEQSLIWSSGREDSYTIATSRAYHVLLFMSLTIPWFTVLGSPSSPRRQFLPQLEPSPAPAGEVKGAEDLWDLASLESAYVVALVGDERFSGQKSTAGNNPALFGRDASSHLSPTKIQADSRDYAFDLLASPENPAFKSRTHPYRDSEEEEPTRITLRAYDRLLRTELRHAVPLELFALSRIIMRLHAGGTGSGTELGMEEIVRHVFPQLRQQVAKKPNLVKGLERVTWECLDQQVHAGVEKNGPRPGKGEGDPPTMADLLWRMM